MDMQFLPILVVGFAASLGLTPLSRAIALRLGVVDAPGQRKIHLDHKPLMGGLAIYGAFVLALILFSPPQYIVELGAVISGAGILALVGLADDRFNLGIGIRLAAQIAVSVVLILAGIRVQLFGTLWLDVPITILWIVGVTNALNFLDNMDGLAAGVTGIAAAFFTLIALNEGLTLVSSLAAALAGAAAGFLIYNFSPASTFMGDMGSLVIGFVLAVLGIKLEFGAQPLSVTWMVPILVLGMPLLDITLVVFTRIREGRSPVQGGKDHSSHRLLSMGLGQRATALILYVVCVVFGSFGAFVSVAETQTAFVVGLIGLGLMGVLFVFMVWAREKYQNTK
jgi:UDP-GlcNAc:undecaprenyl-phosphate GlcNAc-1-phosphate transferase